MIDKSEEYLHEEIVEEGDIYICFKYLEKNYDWNLENYAEKLKKYTERNICTFYKYVDDEPEDIPFNHISFKEENSLKGINFLPSDTAWEILRKRQS